ncbi:MAG: hypothetical protein IPH80_27020 [Myxococcales bacterium]|nr:hypothetical protein [Myxococcales bacterium]
MADAAPRSGSPWFWRGAALAFAALIAFAFYSECRQGEVQDADAERAMRCALGPPPVAVDQIAPRYRRVHALARERDLRHPQICRNTFLNAARYHGNASSRALQFALERVPPLLAADDATLDEAALIDALTAVARELAYDQPR